MGCKGCRGARNKFKKIVEEKKMSKKDIEKCEHGIPKGIVCRLCPQEKPVIIEKEVKEEEVKEEDK